MTESATYNYINANYGVRGCWISELAQKFGITYGEANYLTYAIGYRRGKLISLVPLAAFTNDPTVKQIVSKICSVINNN